IGGELAADAVDFTVSVTGGGKSMPLDPGTTYVSRTLPLERPVEPGRATGVLYDPAAGALRFVPTTFETEDGAVAATLKRNGNGVYAVIEGEASFRDLAPGHWGKAAIELLASKLIVTGVSADRYDPSAQVTRGEFAALLVRALGLAELPAGASA